MTQFICSSCGYGTASWYGKCPACGEWNTMTEKRDEREKSFSEEVKKTKFVSLSKVVSLKKERKSTGVFEFDRVLGGGVVKGEVILLAGEPGVGKSTLLLTCLGKMATVYISGEESGEQVRQRAERIGTDLSQLYFSDETQIEGILASLREKGKEIDVLVIDSIQTVYTKDIASSTGSVSQLKEVAKKLIDFAKKNSLAVIIIGHITKEGEIAGPKMLEHLVDCVLYLEGERYSHFRILRSLKNRFGPTEEVGIFEMRETGFAQVQNPTAFLAVDKDNAPGKAIVGVCEGGRPLFFEIQSLVVPTALAFPRRVVKGVDYNKVLLLLAVLKKNLHLSFDRFDIYVNVVGGILVKSTAADLGIATSIVSSVKNVALPYKSVFIGEIGLLGEIRSVIHEAKIIKEAKRFGFVNIYSARKMKSVKEIASLF